MPPDVRKGYAFPLDVFDYPGGYASNPRRSLEIQFEVARKARGFPHIGRQSREPIDFQSTSELASNHCQSSLFPR